MKKLISTTSAVISHSRSLLLGAVVLTAISGSAALAAPAGKNAAADADNYCQLVKNANARGLCSTARDQFYQKNFRSALVTMKQALDASPKEGIINAMMARIILVGLGAPGPAEAQLRKALENGAPRETVVPVLLRIMVDRHEETALLTEFPEPAAGAKSDEAAEILHGRALALSSLDRQDEAAAAMDRAISIRRDVTNLTDRAEIANRQNNAPLANKLVDAAYQLDPKDRTAVLAKLKQIRQSGDAAKTIAFSGKVLEQFPDDLETRRIRIESFLTLKQDAKAKAEVDAILAKAPKSSYGAYYRALLMARANQKPQAYQIMIALPPTFVRQNPSLVLPMAQLAFDTGHAEIGGTWLGNALSAAPDLLDARLRLAELRLSQNSPQSALTVLAPAKDSRDPRVKKLMGQAQTQIAKDRAF